MTDATKPGKNVFTNSAGKSYPITGLSPMEIERIRSSVREKFVSAGRRLDPPTYTATDVSGTVQKFPHTETTIETPEDRAAFAEYQTATQEMEIESNTRLSQAAVFSIDVDPLTDSRWVSRMKRLGFVLPDDSFDLLTLYAETEVIKAVEDIAGLISAVLYAGGTVDEGGYAAAEAAFRAEISKLYRNNADPVGKN